MATINSTFFTGLGAKRAAAISKKIRRLGTTPDAYFKQLLDADLELDHLVATKSLAELSAPIRKAFQGVSEEEIGRLVDVSRKRHRHQLTMQATRWMFIGFCVSLPFIGGAGPDGIDQKSFDDAYARLHAKEATTKPTSAQDELAALKRQNLKLANDLKEAQAEITRLQQALAAATPAQSAEAKSKVVLSDAEFGALRQTPFGIVKVNSIGWVNAARVERVISESSAMVDVMPDDGSHTVVLFEGIETKDLADGSDWRPFSWFKIIEARKLDDGTKCFVAWPVIQNVKPAAKPKKP